MELLALIALDEDNSNLTILSNPDGVVIVAETDEDNSNLTILSNSRLTPKSKSIDEDNSNLTILSNLSKSVSGAVFLLNH